MDVNDPDCDYFSSRIPVSDLEILGSSWEYEPLMRGSAWRRRRWHPTAQVMVFSTPYRVFVSFAEREALVAVAVPELHRTLRFSSVEELMFAHVITLYAGDAVKWLKAGLVTHVVVETYAMKAPLAPYLMYLTTILPGLTRGVFDISQSLRPWPDSTDHLPTFELYVVDRLGIQQSVPVSDPGEFPARLWKKDIAIPGLGTIRNFPTFAVVGDYCLGGFTMEILVSDFEVLLHDSP
jgi:hypothetical protein